MTKTQLAIPGASIPVEEWSQIMTFMVSGELYGLDILKVQEIRSFCPMTIIPNSPESILGMMNLRGAIVPVVDMRRKLQMENAESNEGRVIIIAKISSLSSDKQKTIGLVVDGVREASSIAKSDLQKPPPDYRGRLNEEAIQGLVALDGEMGIVLDPERLFYADFF